MTHPKVTVAEVRKGIIAAAGFVAEALSLGLLHGTAEHYATLALAALTAAGVYVVPNAVTRPQRQEALARHALDLDAPRSFAAPAQYNRSNAGCATTVDND